MTHRRAKWRICGRSSCPDGRHFIYQAQTAARGDWAIFAGSIDSPDRHKVVQSDYARFAAPDLLLYSKGDNLLAQTMDMRTRQLTGDPVVVVPALASLIGNGRAGFTVSDAGVLVYSGNPDQGAVGLVNRRLTWVDRSGKPVETVGPPVSAFTFRLSPDGARVALLEQMATVSGRQLWVADLGRNVKAPLTTDRRAGSPAWSDDGARLVFGSEADDGRFEIAQRLANGATAMTTLHREAGQDLSALDESSDGTRVVFARTDSGIRSLYVLSKVDNKVVPYLADGFDHPQASLSRDGRWLAYTTNESGNYEVVVQTFPDPSGGKWPISAGGGAYPRWRRDGRELFYLNGAMLVAVPVTMNPSLVPGTARPLFALNSSVLPGATGAYQYDVSPDGQRILLSVAPGGLGNFAPTIPLTVVTNWTSLMKK